MAVKNQVGFSTFKRIYEEKKSEQKYQSEVAK